MPRRYPSFPYMEVFCRDLTNEEIEDTVEDFLSQNPHLHMKKCDPLDAFCKALNVDVEYSPLPCEVLLDVPLNGRPVIWLEKNSKPRQDRMNTAIGIGHWLLHVPATRDAHHGCGIQALYSGGDKLALDEARRFAQILLMPAETFKLFWYEGLATHTADNMNVPTKEVYARARDLNLSLDGGASARRA